VTANNGDVNASVKQPIAHLKGGFAEIRCEARAQSLVKVEERILGYR
jgi:hypothetical protein